MMSVMNDTIQPLVIQKYIQMAQNKGMISFAAGLPDLSVLPLEQLKKGYQSMADLPSASFQYQAPNEDLKRKIQQLMKLQSVDCTLDEVLVTNGAQQAIYLLSQLFFRPKASVMIEELVYPGFLQIANRLALNYVTLPVFFDRGLDLDYLETVLKTQRVLPYLYTVCNGHNPLGLTINQQARKDLAFLSEKYHLILIEDDPYGFLNFNDEQLLPLRAYTKNAVYIGSFSKIIAPAVRTGWVVAEKEIIQKLHQLKDMNDLYLSNPNHLAVNQVLNQYSLEEITKPQKELYLEKRNCMIAALKEHLKIPYSYTIPSHGMFLWLEFSKQDVVLNHEALFKQSQVLYIPETAFVADASYQKQGIRLNFTYPSCEEIRQGIKQLSVCLNQPHKVAA